MESKTGKEGTTLYKPTKCPPIMEWINKCSVLVQWSIWMYLKNIILREKCQLYNM
jgi:hypothetical protein